MESFILSVSDTAYIKHILDKLTYTRVIQQFESYERESLFR